MKKHFLWYILSLFFTNPLTAQPRKYAEVSILPAKNLIISKDIYGHFSEYLGRCIYDGFYRNGKIRMDVVEALKKIKVPNLRWPGGCFADEYHWMDGIGPKELRPKRVNTTWGMVTEDNSFGTQEFLQLCALIGCEPYIAGNVGTATPQEMANWLEYLNFDGSSTLADLRRKHGHPEPYRVSLWGVGNESWGCGGDMTPEYYASEYKKFANFCKTYPGSPRLRKVAGGANADDYHWTEVLMKHIPTQLMWGLSLHYYTWLTGKWPPTGSATDFTEAAYFQAMKQALRMEEILSGHEAIMDKYDPEKKVALVVDEWGIWTKPEPGTNPAFLYQQNSLRDALIAASTLNIFNNRCDRIKVANLAQTVNVLQALILTSGDSMLLTPTYHVFDMYKVHQDAEWLPVQIQTPYYRQGGDSIAAVNVSASKDSHGAVHISLVNLDAAKAIQVNIALSDRKLPPVSGQVLTSARINDVNTFSHPDKVTIKKFTAYRKEGGVLQVELPSKSVVVLEMR